MKIVTAISSSVSNSAIDDDDTMKVFPLAARVGGGPRPVVRGRRFVSHDAVRTASDPHRDMTGLVVSRIYRKESKL